MYTPQGPRPSWRPIAVHRGQTLALGKIDGAGARAYLLVRGGFDAPLYLGSRATFTLGWRLSCRISSRPAEGS